MFYGTLKNTFVGNRPLARLSLGITGIDGQRAALEFVRDDASGDLVASPNYGLALDTPAPTESEINEMYLVENGWVKTEGHPEPPFTHWEDPLTGGYYFFANALTIQEGRDLCAGTPDSAAHFANDETPLGESFGGE